MKTFWTLYVKEWKDSRQLLGVLLVGIAALELYGWYIYDPSAVGPRQAALYRIPFGLAVAASFFAPSFMLARSFSSEWKSETHYQWFSLPVNRWITVLGKFVVALGHGITLLLFSIFGFVLGNAIYTGDITPFEVFFNWLFGLSMFQVFLAIIDVVVIFCLPVLIAFALTLALVTAMESVKFTVHRYRGVLALVFFGGTIYLFVKFLKSAFEFFRFLGTYKPYTFWHAGSMSHGVELAGYAYPLLAIVLLLGLGLWLFEKRVEI